MTDLYDEMVAPVAGPTKEQLKEELLNIVATAEFPPYSECIGDMHPETYAALKREWDRFDGPVNNNANFIVWVELEEGWCAVAHCVQRMVTLSVAEEDMIDFDLGRVVDKTEQIKAEKTVLPNAPCTCSSGRKFKKCCGRFLP
jgi:hypothetical protein